MSTSISVVVPTYNSESVIGQCLASLKSQTHPPVSVIVCDGGSTDGTVAIANDWGATVMHAEANRSAQRNAGAVRAPSEYIVFIDSDMRLTPDVLEECVATFQESDAALVIPEIDVGKSYWARVRGFERSFYKTAWWLHAARCYRKAQFLEIGGFDVALVGPEDWDLDERIRHFGDIREISAAIQHDEGRADFGRLMGKKAHYAASLEVFRERHPKRAALCLSGRIRLLLIMRQPSRLLAHPVLAAGMLKIGIAEMIVARGWSKRWNTSNKEKPLDPDRYPLLGGDLE